MNHLIRAACLLALAAPSLSKADSAADLHALRDEIKAMRSQYEERIRSLEARLQAAEAAVKAAPPVAAPAAPAPAVAAAPPAAAAAPGSGTGFNPALSLILSGLYTNTSRDPSNYRISGFQLPPDAEIGPGTRSFSLAESELTLSASVDPWFGGSFTMAVAPDNSVSVEEAFVQTTSLGQGLTLKAVGSSPPSAT